MGLKIALFADRLDRKEPTGIGVYISRMTEILPAIYKNLSFTILSPKSQNGKSYRKHPNAVYTFLSGPRKLNLLIPMLTQFPTLDWAARSSNIVHSLLPLPIGTRKPLVVTVHDLSPILYPSQYIGIQRFVFRFAMRQAVKLGHHFIAVSNQTAQDIKNVFGISQDKISVIYSGVDQDKIILSPSQISDLRRRYNISSRFVLFIGTLTHRKNLVNLVHAFHKIADDIYDVDLVLAGKPGLGSDEVLSAIERLRLSNRVVMPGYVPQSDLPALIAMAEALVYPSVYEGFGWPPLEAMVQDTPVIASRGGSIPEIVGDAALLSDPDDRETLSRNIATVLLDADVANSLRSQGRQRLTRFTWEESARQVVDVYHQILWSSRQK